MAKEKNKKINAAAIMRAMEIDTSKQIIITCGAGEGALEVPVKSRLSIHERIALIDNIVDMVFLSGEDGDSYYPALKKFAVDYSIVNYFTDVALPSGGDKALEFLERTSLADTIVHALPADYIEEIIAEAYEAIEYRKQELLKRNKLDNMIDSIADVIKAVGDKTEGLGLSQIMEYVQSNAPELKGELEKLMTNESAAATAV